MLAAAYVLFHRGKTFLKGEMFHGTGKSATSEGVVQKTLHCAASSCFQCLSFDTPLAHVELHESVRDRRLSLAIGGGMSRNDTDAGPSFPSLEHLAELGYTAAVTGKIG